MADLVDEALALIEQHPLKAHFVGPRDEKVVEAADVRLGLRFPAPYRRFLLELGAGAFGAAEFYGVVDESFTGPMPDGVWATLDSRGGPSRLPTSMIVVGDDGMGGEYVLDTAKGQDPPVEVWQGGESTAEAELEEVAPDFAYFLFQAVLAEKDRA